jgi:hypothetical protein
VNVLKISDKRIKAARIFNKGLSANTQITLDYKTIWILISSLWLKYVHYITEWSFGRSIMLLPVKKWNVDPTPYSPMTTSVGNLMSHHNTHLKLYIFAHICLRDQSLQNKQTNSVALSLQVNYTDWVTATCWQNLVLTFADRGVLRGQRGRSPHSR